MELYHENRVQLPPSPIFSGEVEFGPRCWHQKHSYLLPRILSEQTEATALEAIFSLAKEHMKQLVFHSPVDFFRQFSKQMEKLENELRGSFIPDIANRAHVYGQTIVRVVQKNSGNYRDIFDHIRELMNIYHAQIFPTPRTLDTKVHIISWAELQEMGLIQEQGEFAIVNPAVFGKQNIPGEEVKILLDKRVAYKGGYARLLARGCFLQKYANEKRDPPITLRCGAQAEYPPTDVDAILQELNPTILSKLEIKSTDAEWDPHLWDKETGEPNRTALREYFHRRDVRANGVILFPGKGLYMTAEAAKDLREGTLRLGLSDYDIFGIYSFDKHKKTFFCPKALFRLLNPLLGGYHREHNQYVRGSKFDKIVFETGQLCPTDLGIYWMALARKVIAKPDAIDRLAQLHNMAVQMGATTIQSPLKWWQKLAQEYPEFDLNSREQTDQDLLPWFSCKILAYIHRLLKKDFGISEAATGIQGRKRAVLGPIDTEVIRILYQTGCDGMSAEVYREQFKQFIEAQKKTT